MAHQKKSSPTPKTEERMVLRGPDRDAFLKAVANPPPPAARLIAAFKRHAELTAKNPGQSKPSRRKRTLNA